MDSGYPVDNLNIPAIIFCMHFMTDNSLKSYQYFEIVTDNQYFWELAPLKRFLWCCSVAMYYLLFQYNQVFVLFGFLSSKQDTDALSEAIKTIQSCFLCRICFDSCIYTDNPVCVCENWHWMCTLCRERWDGDCPDCRRLMSDGFTFNWPPRLFKALNSYPQLDIVSTKFGFLMIMIIIEEFIKCHFNDI